MKSKTNKIHAESARRSRQNWVGSLLLTACALVATLLTPAAALAQHVQSNDALAQATSLQRQVGTLAQHIGGVQQQLDTARTCPPGFYRLSVRLPVSSAYVTGCFNTANPCDDTVRNAENVLLRDHARIGRLEREVTTLRAHQTAMEQVITSFLDCGDRDSCVEAAEDARMRLADAYNASVQLSVWALQQNDWDEAAVAEFQRLQQQAQSMLDRLANLENWRTTVVDPKLADLQRQINAVAAQAQGTADTLATARRRRLTLGLFAGGAYFGGPGTAPSLGAVVGGIDVVGCVIDSAPGFVVAGSLTMGYGETTNGARGGFLNSFYAGAGWEWANAGRILLQGGYTRVESSKWRETTMLAMGGLRLRGEYDISRTFTIYANAGWEWGNAIDVSNGAPIEDASRFNIGGGLSVRLGNW